jgi:hypothetical protein
MALGFPSFRIELGREKRVIIIIKTQDLEVMWNLKLEK